jgi:hypothetical protein
LQPPSKPYDRFLKSLADDDPRSLLHLFGIVPISEEVVVESTGRGELTNAVPYDVLPRDSPDFHNSANEPRRISSQRRNARRNAGCVS